MLLLGGSPTAGQGERAVIWERAREATDRYRTVVDSSGLVDVDSHLSPGVDAEDLQALCRARERAIELARASAEMPLRGLMLDDDPISNEKRAVHARRLGAVATYVGDLDRALEHLRMGRDALADWVDDYPDLKPRFMALQEILGITHLRRAEVENCLAMPGSDMCLFPIRPGGVHHHQEGAIDAVEQFQAYLKLAPDDLEVRWLLNLSYMLLGRYPEDVPRNHLLGPELFESEAEMPRFMDVARPAKLGEVNIAGGTIAEDFDGDGLLDVLFTAVDYCSPARLYRNRGDGTFEDRTEAARLLTQLGGLNAVQTDYDNDGRVDVFVMRGGWEVAMRNSLLRNNPDGTFTDVTREAGLSSAVHATHSVAWADFDNDGLVDVFVAHELTPSQLFRNRGDGTFEDVSARAGLASTAFTKGVVAGDYDNDNYPDLYLSNMFGENVLFHNNRDGTFTDVAGAAGVKEPFVSFPTWFFDYDNDGWLDIFVASYAASVEEFVKHYLKTPSSAETLTLYRNDHDGTFTNVSRETRLDRVVPAMGANFGDLDSDGFLDMYLGTGSPSFGALMPNIMLRNDRGRRFQDVTEATGTGHLQKGHGVAFADLDNDGDQDVILNSGGAVPGDNYGESLFENPGPAGQNWVSVRLVGVKTNRAAIGAKIRVTLPDDSSGSAQRFREVTSGGSFGASSFRQHIGIGTARAIPSIEVTWPVSGTKQTFRDVAVNQFIEIRELDERFTVVTPPRVRLAH
jgi:hypothetical protein